MGKILIKNGNVWDGEKFFYSDVLTDNGYIKNISPDITENADFVFDAKGKIVSSGLVDIHTHMTGYYGINAEMSCIPFGVTAAVDVSAESFNKEKYDNFLIKNKVFISAEIEDNKVKYDNIQKNLEHYKEKAIGIKVYFDTTISDVKNAEPLQEICEFAKNKNLLVMVHSSNSPVPMSEIISVLNKGDILTHAYHGGENNASCDNYECLKSAKEKGVIIDAGFAGGVHTDFKVFESAVKKGILPDTISTDITRFSAYKRGGRYGMTMCMSMAKKLGLSDDDIFRSVTSIPSEVLGKENKWGFLKVGRFADIAVFDYCNEGFCLTDNAGNSIESKSGYKCLLTVVNGEVLYKH